MSNIPSLPPSFALDLPSDDNGSPPPRQDFLGRLKRADDARPGIPGEHWVVGGLGALLLLSAGRRGSFVGRFLKRALGAALLARAASGRQGALAELARRMR